TFAQFTPVVHTLWLQIGDDGTPAQTPPIMFSVGQVATVGSVSSPPQPSCMSIPTTATDPSKVLMYAPSSDSWTRSPKRAQKVSPCGTPRRCRRSTDTGGALGDGRVR